MLVLLWLLLLMVVMVVVADVWTLWLLMISLSASSVSSCQLVFTHVAYNCRHQLPFADWPLHLESRLGLRGRERERENTLQ